MCIGLVAQASAVKGGVKQILEGEKGKKPHRVDRFLVTETPP